MPSGPEPQVSVGGEPPPRQFWRSDVSIPAQGSAFRPAQVPRRSGRDAPVIPRPCAVCAISSQNLCHCHPGSPGISPIPASSGLQGPAALAALHPAAGTTSRAGPQDFGVGSPSSARPPCSDTGDSLCLSGHRVSSEGPVCAAEKARGPGRAWPDADGGAGVVGSPRDKLEGRPDPCKCGDAGNSGRPSHPGSPRPRLPSPRSGLGHKARWVAKPSAGFPWTP